MKTKKMIIILFSLLFIACGNKPIEQSKNISETVITNTTNVENTKENGEEKTGQNSSIIIFSTIDLSSSDLLTPEKTMQKTLLREYYDNGATFSFIVLPSFNNKEIVIELREGGDYPMYYLCVINAGIVDVRKSLNITPHWSEPGNEENNYSKKAFKIYNDYKIEINTEEKQENSDVQKYTKYYKINDDGDFYEVKHED